MKTYKDFINECPCNKGAKSGMKGKGKMKGKGGMKGKRPMKDTKTNVSEDALSFTYNDGGDDMTVVISGSSSELKKIKKNLPAGTKMVDNVPKDALKITASDWSNLQ